MDLGANAWATFAKVTLPLIAPGILAGGLLAFALSIDDFVITNFNAGSTITFPLYVYGARARRRAAAGERHRDADLPRGRRGLMLAIVSRRGDAPTAAPVSVCRWHTSSMAHRCACSRRLATTCGCTSRAWAATRRAEVPIIVRGEGCYLEDANGKRYLDALAGLFAVQIGYSYGDEIGAGGARADARAAVLHELVVRASARDRARRRDRRRSRPAT